MLLKDWLVDNGREKLSYFKWHIAYYPTPSNYMGSNSYQRHATKYELEMARANDGEFCCNFHQHGCVHLAGQQGEVFDVGVAQAHQDGESIWKLLKEFRKRLRAICKVKQMSGFGSIEFMRTK